MQTSNSRKHVAPLTLDQLLLVGGAVTFSSLKIALMRLIPSPFKTNTPRDTQIGVKMTTVSVCN